MLEGLNQQAIDVIAAVEKRLRYSGIVSAAKMSRLLDAVKVPQAKIEVSIEFSRDLEGQAQIVGELATEVEMTCQRCLQACLQPVHVDFCLNPVANESQAEELTDKYQAIITAGETLDLLSVLEDELLINSPLISMHDEKECPVSQRGTHVDSAGLTENNVKETSSKVNPFAILADLNIGS